MGNKFSVAHLMTGGELPKSNKAVVQTPPAQPASTKKKPMGSKVNK